MDNDGKRKKGTIPTESGQVYRAPRVEGDGTWNAALRLELIGL
jgi:hypothetical protein